MRKKADPLKALEDTAHRIAESMNKIPVVQEWNQERIFKLYEANGKVGSIPLDLIKTGHNIRKTLDVESSEQNELVESIRVHGILQPPVVTIATNDHGVHSILLIGGERRLRAARKLGMIEVNCLVKIFENPSTRLTASMAENINRKDLDPVDVAECYRALSEQGYKYSELEKLFGRNEKTIGRFIKIGRWPEDLKNLIREHPAKFNARFLLAVASKKLTDEEVRILIKEKIEGSKQSERVAFVERFNSYILDQKFSDEQRSFLLRVFGDLGIMKTSNQI
jgi:ParB family transcriptional regulator, chromosome partitioning protein